MEDDLEKSWHTLDIYSRSGRMGPNGDIEKALSLATENLELNDEANGLDNDSSDFVIPELPSGRALVFKLLTTWGDPFYVGLNGIEVFTDNGSKANVESIVADFDCDISETPVCALPENLLNGNNRTKDETSLWMTKFDIDSPVVVTINFREDQSIAMIRIWNYNKSRVHAARGVRQLEITLDDKLIFKGEISRADGLCETNSESLGDTILFTMDDAILEAISENDVSMQDEIKGSVGQQVESLASLNRRPSTGDPSLILGTASIAQENHEESHLDCQFSCEGDNMIVRGKVFHMELRDNWGCPDMIGLTGFQFLGRDGHPLAVTSSMLQCSNPNNVNK
uniref:KATNIP domain-containing protein n=1 Tax=Plectus sambesii TaxID=2011161 RepID=A0A914W5S6_9BILA